MDLNGGSCEDYLLCPIARSHAADTCDTGGDMQCRRLPHSQVARGTPGSAAFWRLCSATIHGLGLISLFISFLPLVFLLSGAYPTPRWFFSRLLFAAAYRCLPPWGHG